MSSGPAQDQLAKALGELLRSKGIELPNIPDTPGRRAYLSFLTAQGYSEEELLPVIQREKVTPEMRGALLVALMQAAQSNDPKFVTAVVWMAQNTIIGRDNTNLIVHGLAAALTADLKKAKISVPTFYAGVFPTDSYNAQCKIFNGERLVFLDTGCMEMAETIVMSFLSKAQTTQKIAEISSAIDRYVLHGQRADSSKVNSEGVNFDGGLVSALVNSFEEYMLAHELGHLALGHAEDRGIRHLKSKNGSPLDVVEKSEFQEFQADVWACRALIHVTRTRNRTDSDLALAVGGLAMGLGVGLLVEASAQKHGIPLPPGHPPARERLYMLEVAFELFGAHKDAYIGRRFHELLEAVVAQRYPATELPPMLDRSLNQKMLPVLDSLKIDYSKASYIRDFA